MKNNIFYIILLLFFVSSADANPSETDKQNPPKIIIISESDDQLIFIDDSLTVLAIGEIFTLPEGNHSIRVSSYEEDSWSTKDWNWEGEVISDSIYKFTAISQHFSVVNSIPYGAIVLIEGKEVGTTPYLLRSTDKAIELVLANYMPLRIEADKLKGKSLISVKMIEESVGEELTSSTISTKLGERNGQLFHRSAYAITALSGIAAVYFKFEADKAFNKLENAVDPKDINFLDDRVKKFDDLAAVSFGTFQVGFLYSIYRMIRH